MILSCHHISKAFLEEQILSDVTFHLEKGDKAAIVGINGAGKTTLLRIMTGELAPDEGQVSFSRDTTLGYLAQNQGLDSEKTIFEEMLDVKKEAVEMEERIRRCERLMEELTGPELEKIIIQYNDLMTRFRENGGYSYRGEITGILRGLGFSDDEFEKSVAILSGGQKTRVALAKLLLENPDIIMLDEPTNHLDIGAIRWLEGYIANYRGTVLIVSHDRYFLDRAVSKIIEIDNTKATLFNGNYSAYAERKKALREEMQHRYLNNQAQIRHQEEVIRKLKQFNREKSIKRAESREKMLSRMEVVQRPVTIRDDMKLILTPCIRSGRDVCEVRHLAKSFDETVLYHDITFDIRRGEHVAILGNNGTGKSTLLKIIIGQLQADEGTVRFGTNVHIGYYDQEHHVLDDDNTVFEEIGSAFPDMTNTEIRSLLASFLFTGEDVFKLIRDLSGGEKGRVSLAKLMLSEANFLILDEPTNHLDMVSKEVLENALNSYEGTVLYVSHDRYFINKTASRILNLTQNLMLDYPGNNADKAPECYMGNYDFFLEKSAQVEDALVRDELMRIGRENEAFASMSEEKRSSILQPSSDPSAAAGTPATDGKDDWQQRKAEAAKARKLQNELKKCEDRIQTLEERNSAIDEEMALPENCTDIAKLGALQKEKTANEQELETLYEKWEELQM